VRLFLPKSDLPLREKKTIQNVMPLHLAKAFVRQKKYHSDYFLGPEVNIVVTNLLNFQ
jgi:hypothetical protein